MKTLLLAAAVALFASACTTTPPAPSLPQMADFETIRAVCDRGVVVELYIVAVPGLEPKTYRQLIEHDRCPQGQSL